MATPKCHAEALYSRFVRMKKHLLPPSYTTTTICSLLCEKAPDVHKRRRFMEELFLHQGE